MQTSKLSKKIVSEVVSEIMSRNGFNHIWDDLSPNLRKEILTECQSRIEKYLSPKA